MKLTQIFYPERLVGVSIYESFSDAREVFRDRDGASNKNWLEANIETFKDAKKRKVISGQEADIGYWVSQGWEAFDDFVQEIKTRKSKRSKKKERWEKASE